MSVFELAALRPNMKAIFGRLQKMQDFTVFTLYLKRNKMIDDRPMKTKELKDAISDLPVDQRVEIADYILKTLNQPDPEVEKAWAKEARRRLKEFEEGKVEAIPGEQVHQELREKYSK